jgi:iron-sulfur cluster repair protein YtfE (RIC family)
MVVWEEVTMKKTSRATSVLAEHPPARFESSNRLDPFQVLVAEHELLLHQLDRVSGIIARERLQGPPLVLESFASSLVLHLRREDRALLPMCEQLFGGKDGAAAVVRSEHAGIRSGCDSLVRLAKTNAVGSVASNVRGLEEGLARHFQREEHVLFPLMAALLTNAEGAVLARQIRNLAERRA